MCRVGRSGIAELGTEGGSASKSWHQPVHDLDWSVVPRGSGNLRPAFASTLHVMSRVS
jgi:hypothetical protein